MGTAITFDFHNTLVRCNAWFDLEVRDLPAQVGTILGLAGSDRVTEKYRALRREIIAHGDEMDAVAGVIESWKRIGVEVREESVQPVVDELMRELVPRSVLLNGARDSLEFARKSADSIGVISSAVHHDFLEWSLEWHGVRPLLDDVVTSAQVGFYKSRAEIYEIAMERLGSVASQSIHVGDSFAFDHVMGSSLGMRTIWFNEDEKPVPEGKPLPSVEIASMTEAADAINILMAEISRNGANGRAH